MLNEKTIYQEILEISKEDLKEIETNLEAYSEDGELYRDFGIEEDASLFTFDVEFDNGYSCRIVLSSGQCNCYIDCIFTNPEFHEAASIICEDSLCDGDILEFDVDGEHFEIKIKGV